ncbi:hypothetical protein B0H14DRAFT_2652453 [Mycena olivaceomarginata]|nr:hypothetical protein B0H14DRAFT_2652453 [Mycena olivaceomarginata]
MRDVCAWRGTRKGGGGGVDVLLHLGDVWKGPEGEMVLGRVLVSGNPKIVYFGLKWTILDGVMPRLDVARELKRHTSFAAAIGGRKRLDGRKSTREGGGGRQGAQKTRTFSRMRSKNILAVVK